MKNKSVCQQTGLTDRAVRFYIEKELLSPDYEENYLGRRSYDFSEADVRRLQEICVLRKFDFSIPEIREAYTRPEAIGEVLTAVIGRKQESLDREQGLLQALRQAEGETFADVGDLVAILAKPAESAPPTVGDEETPRARFARTLRAVGLFLLAWLPIVLSVIFFQGRLHLFYYPVFNFAFLILWLLSLLPSILLLLFPRLPLTGKKRRRVKCIVIVLCVLSILVSPVLSLGIIARSETTDFVNYRDFDPDCIANRYDFFQDLFPKWPHYYDITDDFNETVYLDAHYLYRYLPAWDYTYDIYAEWPLDEDEFYTEIERVRSLFDKTMEEYREKGRNLYKFSVTEKGSYTCFILYDIGTPFEPVPESYTYYIFAYNETERKVRYLLCDSLENGYDQPYYLELDWD